MKKFKSVTMLAAMAATLTLGSCSSDELSEPAVGGSSTGDTFVAFNIKMPRAVSGRSYSDTYVDGLDEEYAVKDAQVLIFSTPTGGTATEADYTYVEQTELTQQTWTTNSSTSITSEGKALAQLSLKPTDGNDYYALVILNQNKVLDKLGTITKYGDINQSAIGEGSSAFLMTSIPYGDIADQISAGTLASSATAVTAADGKTYDTYIPKLNGIFMTNALRYVDGKLVTLVKIDSFKNSREDALANPVTVYVERGVAKVTINTTGTNSEYWSADGKAITESSYEQYVGDKIAFTAWNTDNSNGTTYAVHTVDGITDFATNYLASTDYSSYMIGSDDRVQWSYTPRYTYTAGSTSSDEIETLGDDGAKVYIPGTQPKYLLENTQAAKSMYKGVTTRVVFKAQYTPAGFGKGDTFYTYREDIYHANATDINTTGDTHKAIADVIQENLPTSVSVEGADNVIAVSNVTIDVTKIKDGKVNADVFSGVQGANAAAVKEAIATYVNSAMNTTKYPIAVYNNGVCYYETRIRHFSDDVSDNVKWNGNTGNEVYTEKHLGRWGVVRNNWYELEITKVSKPGTPDIPTITPGDPDDQLDSYFSVDVKILAWTKRSQQVEF